jgi:predicted HTH transcriptional regulator
VAPKVETPTPPPAPTTDINASEETPPKTEESPRTPPQQGTAQPEETTTPASPPESLPAPATPIPTPPPNILQLLLTKAHLVTQLRKQKKLIKVMEMFATKKSITNDDVEKLLHVSDATALRYLTQLKKENKITQIGKTGQGVTYTKR